MSPLYYLHLISFPILFVFLFLWEATRGSSADTQKMRETHKKPNLTRRRDHPLESEVLDVRRCLVVFVPVELVDLIINYAEYWPQKNSFREYMPAFTVPGWGETSNNTQRFYITSGLSDQEEEERARPELKEKMEVKRKEKKVEEKNVWEAGVEEKPKATRVVKKVIFKIWSHDQGQGAASDLIDSEAAWTWFEAAIFPGEQMKRPRWNQDYPLMKDVVDPLTVPPRESGMWKIWHLQSNIRASADEALHEIIWTDRDDESKLTSWEGAGRGAGTGFVRSIRPGDRIALVARARFPGWVNYVRRAEVQIFYSVY